MTPLTKRDVVIWLIITTVCAVVVAVVNDNSAFLAIGIALIALGSFLRSQETSL